jgi:hypothetical protein
MTTRLAGDTIPPADVISWNEACAKPTYTVTETGPEIGDTSSSTSMGQQPILRGTGSSAFLITTLTSESQTGYSLTCKVEAISGDCIAKLADINVEVSTTGVNTLIS